MTTMIRRLTSRFLTRHSIGETETAAADGAVAATTGFALGVLGAHVNLDRHGIPLDAAAGLLGLGASLAVPLKSEHRDRMRQVSAIAIGVGAARVGERVGHRAGIHGELGPGRSEGQHAPFAGDPLVEISRSL